MNADYPNQLRRRAARFEAQEAERRREEALEARRRRQRAQQWVQELAPRELKAVIAADRHEVDFPRGYRSAEDVYEATRPPWNVIGGHSDAAELAEAELSRRRSGFIGNQPGEQIDLPGIGPVDKRTAAGLATFVGVVLLGS